MLEHFDNALYSIDSMCEAEVLVYGIDNGDLELEVQRSSTVVHSRISSGPLLPHQGPKETVEQNSLKKVPLIAHAKHLF